MAIVLILLLVMTILGMAGLRNTLLEERMSGNLYDRGLAFQAAESALREAESRIASTAGIASHFPAAGSPACNDGLCNAPPATEDYVERWEDVSFAGWKTTSTTLADVAAPQYFIEAMGMAPTWPLCDREVPVSPQCLKPRYRITARSRAAGRAEVVLQTNYSAK